MNNAATDPVCDGLLQLAWTQAWQISLLIAGVLIASWLLGRKRPHLAYALWMIVLLKCVTPPVWSSAGGVFCWLQPSSGDAVAIEPSDTVDRFEYEVAGAASHFTLLTSATAEATSSPKPAGASLSKPQRTSSFRFDQQIAETQSVLPSNWAASVYAVLIWMLGTVTVLVFTGKRC